MSAAAGRAAVASSDGAHVNLHFGHCQSFYIYEMNEGQIELREVRETEQFCTKESGHGKHNGVMEKFLFLLRDCQVILCESIGYPVATNFEKHGIRPYMLSGDIGEALKAWQTGVLELISESQDGGFSGGKDE